MTKFNSKHIENIVRENLKIPAVTEITDSDLLKIRGIMFSENTAQGCSIPWYGDSQAFNMTFPNLCVTKEALVDDDWKRDMTLFPHIVALHNYIENFEIDFINVFPKLKEILLCDAVIDDWSFLSGLTKLRDITLYKSGKNGNDILKLLAELAQKYKRLENVMLQHADISDLTPLKSIRLTELNLSNNLICDVSPLETARIYYLTLRYNKIEDITPLKKTADYMINLRHNKIKSVRTLICPKDEQYLCRLYIGHNHIPAEELEQLREGYWVDCDFPCDYSKGSQWEGADLPDDDY